MATLIVRCIGCSKQQEVSVQNATSIHYASMYAADAFGHDSESSIFVLCYRDIDGELFEIPPDDIAVDWESHKLYLGELEEP